MINNKPDRPIVLLIDGNALMHRAYHAVKFAPVYEGNPVGMVYGVASMLINAWEGYRPDFLFFALDTQEKTFRHEMDAEYKAHRKKAENDFYQQIPLVHDLVEHFGIPILRQPGFEADDIIGTLARKAESENYITYILSADQDFLQLVSERIFLLRPNGNIQHSLLYGPTETQAHLGISPAQVVDYKSLVGDSSDNYKGLPGCGPKTATELLQKYGSLESIFQHITELPSKLAQKFTKHATYIRHCQELAQLKIDVPISISFEKKYVAPTEDILIFLRTLGFRSLADRYQRVAYQKPSERTHEQESDTKKMPPPVQLSLF